MIVQANSTERPKLLFLAYTFPPVQNIACVRTWNMARYLSKLGWHVTVVTPEPSVTSTSANLKTLESKLRDARIRRILTDHRWRTLLQHHNSGFFRASSARLCRRLARQFNIEYSVGWMKPVQNACSKLTSSDVDVILATGPPYTAFRLAERLSDRLRRPFVLDYRDPWNGNPHDHRKYGKRFCTVNKERELLNASAAVTIVSSSWASALDRRFNISSKLHVVTNGYDPEDLADVQPYDFQHFAIVYTGIFRPPKRVITPIMAALQRLKKFSNSWKFHYFGPHGVHVRREAERFAVLDRVVLHGVVPRREALAAVRGAGASVVVSTTGETSTQDDRGMIPAKLFEALGLGTPIVLIAPPGSDARNVVETTSTAKGFRGTDTEGIVQRLLDLMHAKKAQHSCSSTSYAWPVLARQMDRVLRGVLQPEPNDPSSIHASFQR